MVKYKVKIKPLVFQMLDMHVIFLARVSPKASRSLKQTFIKTIKSLDYDPDKHPLWLPDFELPRPYHKILIKKRYLLLFYIYNNNVFVDYLLDCRMDNSKLF